MTVPGRRAPVGGSRGIRRGISYDDVVEEALAFGWVDSLPRWRRIPHASL